MSEFCIWRRVCRALSSSSQDMKEQIRRVRSSQPCRNFPGLKLSLFQCNHLSWSFILILGCRTCGVKQKPPWSPWAMTKYPLTSGLNGCIMRSEETEAAFSSLEKWEYPALLPPLCWCLLGAVGGGKEEESYLLWDKPRGKCKQVLFVALLTSILEWQWSEVAELKTSFCVLCQCVVSCVVSKFGKYWRNSQFPSCKEEFFALRLTPLFSWVSHCEIVLLVLPKWGSFGTLRQL